MKTEPLVVINMNYINDFIQVEKQKRWERQKF